MQGMDRLTPFNEVTFLFRECESKGIMINWFIFHFDILSSYSF